MAIKGYVVRGTHRRGWPVFAYDHSGAFGGPSETDIPLHVFPSLDTASGARAHMVRCGCSDVAIFRVLDDGREERLPSYEEALARLDMVDDILAATGRPGDGDTLVARVGRAFDDDDIPGEEQAKIAEAANREWWRASNTTQGSDLVRTETAMEAQRKADADGKAAYRAARAAQKART